jgi:hypothetical protein
MFFRTKWDLLEYLGKDRKDVRYIDRLMVKDIVEKVAWGYELHDPDKEEIERLKRLIEEKDTLLRGQEQMINKLKTENEWLVVENAELMQEGWWDSDEVIEAVYTFLTRKKRLMLDHDDFVEWVKNVL